MTDQQGRFVWYELMARDTEAAKAFYTKVVGCSTQDASVPGMAYTMFTDGKTPLGGLMAQPADARKMGAPPSWIGYVAVNDVDATAERIKRLGGTVHVPPTDIPNVGRFSVVADPQSAVFALFNSPNTCDAPREPIGHLCEWVIELRANAGVVVSGKTPVTDVRHHADDAE